MTIPMIPTHLIHTVRRIRRATFSAALAAAATSTGCSGTGTTDAGSMATISVISGGNQSVVVASAGLTELPQPVVVYVENKGAPVAGGEVSAAVWMNGAPGPNGAAYFVTGTDGRASMNVKVSGIAGPFRIDVSYVVCTTVGFFGCDKYRTLATVQTTGIAARLPGP